VTRPVEFAQILLQCLGEALDAGPYPIPPEKVCLRFGSEVNPTLGTTEDECCTGLAWARVAGIQSLADLTDPDMGNCVSTRRLITIELGTARCIPFGTVQAGPSCDAWTEVALKMDSDHGAMEAAVCCASQALDDLPYSPTITPGEYTPGGPDGNCVTGTLTVTISYDCGCANAA
jgi:hypothetical protein